MSVCIITVCTGIYWMLLKKQTQIKLKFLRNELIYNFIRKISTISVLFLCIKYGDNICTLYIQEMD